MKKALKIALLLTLSAAIGVIVALMWLLQGTRIC